MVAQELVFNKDTISIYIHWPYCLQKCPYCDFNSFVSNSKINFVDWEQAYINQLYQNEEYLSGKSITSIFFGGGTPSLMEPQIVEKLINIITKINNNKNITEITLESNPSSIEGSKLKAFKEAGVNRVSIGIQSFDNNNLKFLGRNHSAEEAIDVIKVANGIFNRVSFDLINGLPKQTLKDWQKELEIAKDLIGSHISIYELTIEPNTAFFKQKVPSVKSGLAEEMFNYTESFLNKLGLNHYEISNYAKPMQESVHNMQYWQGGLYLGIGPGAHGRISKNNNIYATVAYKNPKSWLELALKKENIYSEFYSLTKEQRLLELLILNLRIYKEIPKMLKNNIKEQAWEFLLNNSLIYKNNKNIFLTAKGKLKLNTVITYLSNHLIY